MYQTPMESEVIAIHVGTRNGDISCIKQEERIQWSKTEVVQTS
jgi:hypothetical protein